MIRILRKSLISGKVDKQAACDGVLCTWYLRTGKKRSFFHVKLTFQ